jgi:hypothetical protein
MTYRDVTPTDPDPTDQKAKIVATCPVESTDRQRVR